MTLRIGKYRVKHISNQDRIQFFGTLYYDNPTGIKFTENREYRLRVDDRKRIILGEVVSDGLTKDVEIKLLEAEIARYEAIFKSLGIDPDNPGNALIRHSGNGNGTIQISPMYYLAISTTIPMT